MRKTIIFFIFFFFTLQAGYTQSADLDPIKAKKKVEEILMNHVSKRKVDQKLIKQTLYNFIDLIDPTKTYFIENEILKYTNPSNEDLRRLLIEYEEGNFATFSQILDLMQRAAERKNRIEESIETKKIQHKNVKINDLESDYWPESINAIEDKIAKIRSMQLKAIETIEDENPEKFFKRLKKRKLTYEKEILGTDKESRDKQMLALFIKAVCKSLDNHTTYFTPREASQFALQVQQRLFGIGALLQDDLDGLKIKQIIDKSPAMYSGKIKEGDKIIAVDHEPIIGFDILDAVTLIRGPEGTTVNLSILRERENQEPLQFDVTLKRGEVVLDETRYDSKTEKHEDGVILTVQLFSFYADPKSSSVSDIKKVIADCREKHKLKGVILDLRNNGGGLLTQAVDVAGLFITNGIVTSIKDDEGQLHHLRTMASQAFYDGPLVVLTNKASASASEIVAQTLQDYGRAIVVGDEFTYGKGTFQIFTLEGGDSFRVNPEGEYKVTKGIYYTVSGKTPQLTGVKSDIEIPGYLYDTKIGERFEPNALANVRIADHFDDDLSDIHPLRRISLRRTYCMNLQKPSKELENYIPALQEKSQKRITSNKDYQAFLLDIKEKSIFESEYGKTDFQLHEAQNVLKDYLGIVSQVQQII